MRKFVCTVKLSDFDIGDEGNSDDISIPYIDFMKLSDSLVDPTVTIESFKIKVEKVLGACHRIGLVSPEPEFIMEMFTLYCKFTEVSDISVMILKATRVAIGKQVFAKHSYRGGSPYSYVIARWHCEDDRVCFRPAIVRDIFEVDAILANGEHQTFWTAKLDWFREHKMRLHYGEKSNITLWDTLFEPEGKNTYIPLRFVKERFVCIQKYMKFSADQKDADKVSLCIKVPAQSFL